MYRFRFGAVLVLYSVLSTSARGEESRLVGQDRASVLNQISQMKQIDFSRRTNLSVAALSELVNDAEAKPFLDKFGLHISNANIRGGDVALENSPLKPMRYSEIPFPIVFENCDIDSLDLSNASLNSLCLIDCDVNEIILAEAEVQRDVSVRDCRFVSKFDAEYMRCGSMEFVDCTATQNQTEVVFRGVTVLHEADLSGSVFHCQLLFMAANIGTHLRCKETTFFETAYFDQSTIGGSLVLTDAVSNVLLSFPMATIGGNVDLFGTTLGHRKYIGRYLHFGEDLPIVMTCGGAVIGGSLHLKQGASVFGVAELDDVSIKHVLEIVRNDVPVGSRTESYSKEPRVCGLTLNSVSAETWSFDVAMLPTFGAFEVDRFSYAQLHPEIVEDEDATLAYLATACGTKFQPHAYRQLAVALKDAGYEHRSKLTLVGMETAMRAHVEQSRGQALWSYVFGPMIGFGYFPLRCLWYAVVEVVIGVVVFKLSDSLGLFLFTSDPLKSDGGGSERVGFNSIMYAVDTFAPLIDLQQARYFVPNSCRPLRLFLWWHISTGWILTSLCFAALTGLVK